MYESNPWNGDFFDLPFDGYRRLITKQPIDCLTDNIVERLKVSFIERFLITECMKVIPEMSISLTYLLMDIKSWSLENKYIVYMMISYLGWTMFWLLIYIQIECKKNKSLVWCMDKFTIKTMQVITKRSELSTYISTLIFVWSFVDK